MPKRKRFSLNRLKHLSKLQLLAVVVVLFLIAGVAYAVFGKDNPSPTPQNTPDNSGQGNEGPPVNLNPPTPAQQQSTDDYKKSLAQPPSAPPATSSGKKQAYPVITSVTSSETNAYVAGVVEDGGICKATATKGSQTLTASSSGFANVSTTSCTPIKLSLPSSGWSVVVSYSSASSEGVSQAYAY